MTPEQLQELEEKAKLWDSLSDTLRTIFCGKFERPTNGTTTIENTSNAKTHIDLLDEELKEMLHLKNLCECGNYRVGNTSRCIDCVQKYT